MRSKIIGGCILAVQVCAMVYARFAPSRYLCWAPYDCVSQYELSVAIDGRELSADEVRDRYHKAKAYTDQRSIHHVIDIVEQYEKTYGASEKAVVLLQYSTNGGPSKEWRWPG